MSALHTQLSIMLSLQDKMNTKVHSEWRDQGFAWFRALWIEAGELMDHQGYKWWKKQTPDTPQVHLEIVDIWHFGLSMLLEQHGKDYAAIATSLEQDINAHTPETDNVLLATEAMAAHALTEKQMAVGAFVDLLTAAGMDFDSLYTAYVGKNVLNFFRQDNGYKEGTYVKQWAGLEDNEHLVEIAANLDSSADDFPDQLYAALAARYSEVA